MSPVPSLSPKTDERIQFISQKSVIMSNRFVTVWWTVGRQTLKTCLQTTAYSPSSKAKVSVLAASPSGCCLCTSSQVWQPRCILWAWTPPSHCNVTRTEWTGYVQHGNLLEMKSTAAWTLTIYPNRIIIIITVCIKLRVISVYINWFFGHLAAAQHKTLTYKDHGANS